MIVELNFRTLDQIIFALNFSTGDKVIHVVSEVCKYLDYNMAVKLIHSGKILEESQMVSEIIEAVHTGFIIVVKTTKPIPEFIAEKYKELPPPPTFQTPVSVSSEKISQNDQLDIYPSKIRKTSHITLPQYQPSPLPTPYVPVFGSPSMEIDSEEGSYEDLETDEEELFIIDKAFYNDIMNLMGLIKDNPEMIKEALGSSSEKYPELIDKIKSNPEELENILNDYGLFTFNRMPPNYDSDATDSDADEKLYISNEERRAIERLQALGFSEELAAKAYFYYECNETAAANFLLSLTEEDIDIE